jgi:hypothetical protein
MGGVSHAIRKGGHLPVQDGLRKLSPHRPLWPMPGLAHPALSERRTDIRSCYLVMGEPVMTGPRAVGGGHFGGGHFANLA